MKMLNGKAFILPDKAPETTAGGIALSDKSKEGEYAPQSGTILAVDSSPHPVTGQVFNLSVGNRVYYPSYASRIKYKNLIVIDLTELWCEASEVEFAKLFETAENKGTAETGATQ